MGVDEEGAILEWLEIKGDEDDGDDDVVVKLNHTKLEKLNLIIGPRWSSSIDNGMVIVEVLKPPKTFFYDYKGYSDDYKDCSDDYEDCSNDYKVCSNDYKDCSDDHKDCWNDYKDCSDRRARVHASLPTGCLAVKPIATPIVRRPGEWFTINTISPRTCTQTG